MEIDDPIIFLEHRWLSVKGDVPENGYSENIDSAKICKKGKDVTRWNFLHDRRMYQSR